MRWWLTLNRYECLRKFMYLNSEHKSHNKWQWFMSIWHPLTVVCSKWQLDLLTERSSSCKVSFLDWWMNLISAKEPWVCIGLSPICKKIWFDCAIRNIYCWIQRLCVKLSSRTGVNHFFYKTTHAAYDRLVESKYTYIL